MDVIDRFLKYLEAELNLSPNTVSAYGRDLRSWADYATGGSRHELRVGDVTTSDIRSWLAQQSKAGCGAATLRRKAQSLRSFYKYLMRHEGISANPAADIIPAKMARSLPVQIKESETVSMLDNVISSTDNDPDSFTSVRDSLILEMLYATGMRCSELTDLRDDAVDTISATMRVIGKRRKERVIPFGRPLAEAIDNYRQLRSQIADSETPALFVSLRGRPMNRRSVYSIVHNAMAEAGIHASRLSPHVMRHSCATDMLNNGADLNTVSRLLGHASLATTQIYTHLTYRDLQTNYEHAHPRAKKKGNNYGT